ncbi:MULTISPECIES: hypothetical protein [Leeuwenhoekiella]|uniref:Uncharacterized protein n=1 Tax=Leeuwenhoekiella palythoae TaxID=573501 RepID=A0A1M5WZY4_9FLAO|nr:MULTISPECIES: hypothetical protein [Leeuwenhoekiella]MAS19493.1 hypothetical protein [Leeuwenhoekiella sp.]MEC7782646.1 hypothetical protein [Bacteroidota bacterium]MBH13922.1 hypothetical protein [Leeuwenhoekiella sp.]MEE3148835.1 hypothetical protein [Bacteroidota bacterium]MEE3244167.1 hypothetical protein [Bacteroidota bacterium]|tara:strand:+ start:4386 stop:5567 length:1182 start_codon:yes stop_codon:yes gene_type:complete
MNNLNKLYLILVCTFSALGVQAQDQVSLQIIKERDSLLLNLNKQLEDNAIKLKSLQGEFSDLNPNRTSQRLGSLDSIISKQENRITLLENSRKIQLKLNGQLAFTELMSIHRDIKPSNLLLSSQEFFSKIAAINNPMNYPAYEAWFKEYQEWYERKKGKDNWLDLINKSITVLNEPASNVPLYGSLFQTFSTGITSAMEIVGGTGRDLRDKTPEMLNVLNTASQFSQQQSIIDNEWKSINEELNKLENEYNRLLEEQAKYYGLDMSAVAQYQNATLDSERETLKNKFRKSINNKISEWEKQGNKDWLTEVERFMVKTQSLRQRFGQLTLRMKSNIGKYQELITHFSKNDSFAEEFRTKLRDLESSIDQVDSNFNAVFNPSKYIEDSAVMYITQ